MAKALSNAAVRGERVECFEILFTKADGSQVMG